MCNRLTTLLNIKYPILQGGMAWISDAKLACAVSNAGGAGIIAAGGRTVEWVRNEIREAKKETPHAFGVNIMLMNPNKEEIIDLVIEESVPFVTTGAGNPIPYIKRLKTAGIKVIPVVPNLKLAQKVEAAGADAIVIEGAEAGGHVGTLGSMSLMTNVIPNINIPVIAAGGFSDGRGFTAALAMGASGLQLGSVFLVAKECNTHPAFKEAIIKATDSDSVVTGYATSHAVRGLKNHFSTKYLEMKAQGISQEELDNFATGTNRKAAEDGDIDNGFVLVGSSLLPINQELMVKEIIDNIVRDAKLCLQEMQTLCLP